MRVAVNVVAKLLSQCAKRLYKVTWWPELFVVFVIHDSD